MGTRIMVLAFAGLQSPRFGVRVVEHTNITALSMRVSLFTESLGCTRRTNSVWGPDQADPQTRDAGRILLAIARARSWIDDVLSGCVRSFGEIAEREGKVERHIAS